MQEPSRPVKIGTVLWSLLLGVGVIALGVSILLPSTKRARFEFRNAQEKSPQDATTLLFGTYQCPNHEPPSFGICEPIAQNYAGQLLHPFRRANSKEASSEKPAKNQVPVLGCP